VQDAYLWRPQRSGDRRVTDGLLALEAVESYYGESHILKSSR